MRTLLGQINKSQKVSPEKMNQIFKREAIHNDRYLRIPRHESTMLASMGDSSQFFDPFHLDGEDRKSDRILPANFGPCGCIIQPWQSEVGASKKLLKVLGGLEVLEPLFVSFKWDKISPANLKLF